MFLSVLDAVNRTREPVTVIRRGKPVGCVVPIPAEPGSSYGIAKGAVSYAAEDDLMSTGAVWDAET